MWTHGLEYFFPRPAFDSAQAKRERFFLVVMFFFWWTHGLQIREIEDFFKFFNFGKVWSFFNFFNFGKVLNFAEVLFAEVLFPEVLFAEVKFPQFSGDKI